MPIFYTDTINSINAEITGSFILSGSLQVTGSLNTGISLTGSLSGTVSFANSFISASFITSSNVFGPFGSNSTVSTSFSISSSLSNDSNYALDGYPIMSLIYNDLGSNTKFENYSYYSIPQIDAALGSYTINTAYLRFIPIYIPIQTSLSGVRWLPATAGVYTANNYNGVTLYSYSAGTLTLVASSSNDGNIWKGTGNTYVSKSFASTYNASPGAYYVGMYFNWSAVTTNPAFYGYRRTSAFSANLARLDFTNNARVVYNTAGTTFTTSSLDTVSVSTLTSDIDVNTIYMGLY